jgi:endonuclease YncB( thermonuclease family)
VGKLVHFAKPRKRRGAARRNPVYMLVAIIVIATIYALSRLSDGFDTGSNDFVFLHDITGSEAADTVSNVSFGLCGRPPHENCVIDGDTFYFEHQSIRIADIDTPEVNPPRCEEEARLGKEATDRLLQLLNSGPFELETIGNRDEDQFGRKLRVVTRSGRSLGEVLTDEGLARTWTGRRLPWCE